MRRRLFSVAALLLTTTLLALFAFAAVSYSAAQSPKLIHVDGSYTPSQTAPNIVTNGGFESIPVPNTRGNWQVITSDLAHSGVIAQSSDAYTESYSGNFTVTANPSSGGFVALSESNYYWAIGQSYTLTFNYKSTFSNCYASVFCKSQPTTVGNDIAYWISGNLPATNVWTPVTLTFGPIPDRTVDLQIHFGPPEGITGTLWIDDVSTSFASNAPTPTPASTPPTPTATPTSNPTPTPTNTPNPTPTPTNPTPSPTSTPTTQPTPTANPTSNPTATPIPELTPAIILAALGVSAAFALFGRKHLKRSGSLAVAVLITILMSTAIANVVNGQTVTPTATPTPVVSYSLWFTNGTQFPTDGRNADGYVIGGPFINIGGIHCIASGFGSSADKTSSVVVLRNDGNIPINVSLALKNAVVPSNIHVGFGYFFMNNRTFQPYSNGWMGNSNVGQNPLAPGQYMWLSVTVSLGQTNVPLTGTPNYGFSYSFDIEVTATQN